MYNIADPIKLHILKISESKLVEKRTFDPINTTAIRYPKKWLLKFLTLAFPLKKFTIEMKIIIINPII